MEVFQHAAVVILFLPGPWVLKCTYNYTILVYLCLDSRQANINSLFRVILPLLA